MAARITVLLLSLTLLPLKVPGQTPPPGVDQALRARVTEFLQYHVDGNFRKAYDMVADDTKDDYFNSGKIQLKGFHIDSIKFTDNFTKAAVIATMSKTMNVAGQDIPVAMPSTTTWKIENNKWVWYKAAEAAPVSAIWPTLGSPPPATAPKSNNQEDAALPKDFSDQTIAAAARSILQQVSVDKREITLTADKTSEASVIFHNGMPGSVKLELSATEMPGFSVKLEQSTVRAGADVPVVFRYEPGDQTERRDPINVQIYVQPLNQTFVVRVNFAAPSPLK